VTALSEDARDFGWLLSSFVERIPGIRDAIVVSLDGLLIALSDPDARAESDRLAAVAAATISIARGAGEPIDAGAVQEIIIEMERALLVVMGMSDGSALAVVAKRPCDVGLLAYEMALLAKRAGSVLTTTLVAELKAALPR